MMDIVPRMLCLAGATVGCASPSVANPAAGPPGAFVPNSPWTGDSAAPAPLPTLSASADAREDAVRILLQAPLAAPRLSFLHSSVDVPPLDTARTLPQGGGFLRFRSAAARSTAEDDGPDPDDNFDGTFREWLGVEAGLCLLADLELRLSASFTGWDEHMDRLEVYDDTGRGVVFGEDVAGKATSRHVNLGTVGLRGKIRLSGETDGDTHLALSPSLRLPVGRERDANHDGTYDAGVALLATLPLGRATVHANLGSIVPVGGQNLLERRTDAALNPFLHGAAGVVLPAGATSAFAAQVEANGSAFHGVRFLDRNPVTAVFGFRVASRTTLLEFGVGTGLDWRSSYRFLAFASVTLIF